jgi:hypothetical protein
MIVIKVMVNRGLYYAAAATTAIAGYYILR